MKKYTICETVAVLALGALLSSCGSLQPLTRSHVTTTRYDAEGRVTETVVEEKSEALAKSWIEATKGCDVVICESGWGVKLAAEPQATSGMLPGIAVKAGKIDTVYQRHATEAAAQNEAANIAANKGEFQVGAAGVSVGTADLGGKSATGEKAEKDSETVKVLKSQLEGLLKGLADLDGAKEKTGESAETKENGGTGETGECGEYKCESCLSDPEE